ncbi:MAG: (d)CMP kinase, partial [Leptonema sp. (in: Bacteria)]|nr:(d)CMP kinase [Leptonema sp. (in: bacteria)]
MTSNETKRIITLDGPAGSGKSTVANILAKKLGYLHADSGALYRSLTVACIDVLGVGDNIDDFGKRFAAANIDPESFRFRVDYADGKQLHFLNEVELGQRIRSLEVTERIRFIADDAAFRNRVNQLL